MGASATSRPGRRFLVAGVPAACSRVQHILAAAAALALGSLAALLIGLPGGKSLHAYQALRGSDCAVARLVAAQPLPVPLHPFTSNTPPWFIRSGYNQDKFTLAGGASAAAIQANYRAGRFSAQSGAQLKGNPFLSLPASSFALSYQVFFPPDFPWVLGGKLPGVCIGVGPGDCAAGGRWRESAGSVRLMWREGGRASAYLYLPLSAGGSGDNGDAWEAQGPGYKRAAVSEGIWGHTVFGSADGGLGLLQAGAWNDVAMQLALGDGGVANGAMAFTINNRTQSVTDMLWRASGRGDIAIVSVVLETFFGGGNLSWSSPFNTYSQFKNFAFSASNISAC